MFGNLLGYGFCGVVEFGIAVASGHIIVPNLLAEIVTERFYGWEEHNAFSGQYGVSVNKIEIPVRVRLAVVVEAVEVHQGQQSLVLHSGLGQIREIYARGVGKEFDVEAELVLLHLSCPEGIGIAHHEVPVSGIGRTGGVTECLDDESLGIVLFVGRELSHLKGLSTVGVFEGYRQDLVGLECRLEGDVSKRTVEGVFAAGEEPCVFQLLIVASAFKSGTVK